jgi:chromosomal replication initiation ATPase DnaA
MSFFSSLTQVILTRNISYILASTAPGRDIPLSLKDAINQFLEEAKQSPLPVLLANMDTIPPSTIFKPHDKHPFYKQILAAKIPISSAAEPDFLLYKLPSKQNRRISFKFLVEGDPSLAVNSVIKLNKKNETPSVGILMGPSGCGKTRTAYEVLSTHLGLYFIASTGTCLE